MNFKAIRISVLLIILFVVAVDSVLTRMRVASWETPLRIVVYPVIESENPEENRYVKLLKASDFDQVGSFMLDEVRRYQLPIDEPVTIDLAPMLNSTPPLPPEDGNMFKTIWWSLKLRYWAFSEDNYEGPSPNVRVYVLYHDYEINTPLKHSTGLEKGMISIVHAFADERMVEKNNVVIAHEILHTLGATDKYDLATGQPIYPEGYAEPDRAPRFPQDFAEIMGGKIPLSGVEAVMPNSLDYAIIGLKTAREIGWIE